MRRDRERSDLWWETTPFFRSITSLYMRRSLQASKIPKMSINNVTFLSNDLISFTTAHNLEQHFQSRLRERGHFSNMKDFS